MARNGQAALEFLTTYGWAFLVIIVMIGALAYFGILNPSRFLPDRCTFPTEVPCRDSQITMDSNKNVNVSFVLADNLGNSIHLGAFNATFVDNNALSDSCTPDKTDVAASQTVTISCIFSAGKVSATPGSKAKFSISGVYNVTSGVFQKPVDGDVYGTVQ